MIAPNYPHTPTVVERKRSQWRISPSQVETYLLCARKWWFERVAKLPRLPKGSTTFGTVLHGVVERYLRADDLGRDPETGLAVEIYPPGWQTATEFDGSRSSVTLAEEGIIRALVAKAIDEGHLVRTVGRQIEAPFSVCVGEYAGLPVMYEGKRDVVEPHGLKDHKTVKTMRYAKSPRELSQNLQALTYSKVSLDEKRQRGEPIPGKWSISHVSYCKDPKDSRVRLTTTQVSPQQIEQYWTSTLLPTIERMHKTREISVWHDVPDPPDAAHACNAYGGCHFASICSQREKPEDYRIRVDTALKATKSHTHSAHVEAHVTQAPAAHAADSQEGFKMVSLAERMAAGASRAAIASGSPTPAAPGAAVNPLPAIVGQAPVVAAPQAPAPAPTASAAPVGDVPPWAVATCLACKGTGFNTKGSPCRICDSRTKAVNGLHSGLFILEATGDGTVVWVPREGVNASEGSCVVPGAGAAEVKSEVREAPVAAAAPVAAPAPVAPVSAPAAPTRAPAAPAPAAEPPSAQSEAEVPAEIPGAKRGRGRPAKGFRLLVGVAPTRISGEVVHLDVVAAELQKSVATALNAPDGYYTIEAFRRRDVLVAGVQQLATSFGTATVVCVDPNAPDMRVLVEALRPLAYEVFDGYR